LLKLHSWYSPQSCHAIAMPDALQVLLVNESEVPPPPPALVEGLMQAGCALRICDPPGQLRAMVDEAMPQAIVLRAPPSPLYHRVAQARVWAPVAALVVMMDGASAQARIAAMEAGADGCCSVSTHAAELAVMLRAALRYRSLTARPVQWRLMARDRVLAGPHNQWLPLTLGESRFLKRMLESPGWMLPRADRRGGRTLDVTVSRLRAKAASLGVNLPLFTVRDWGYMFLADRAGVET